ncbi:MAG: hypothetical protein HY788_12680 [Deltaproteobacteria bacterium]|nr:hypothetical protein [Deltaproteobacteria bacterium]
MRTWIAILCVSALFFSVGNYAAASTMFFPDDPAATDDLHGSTFQTQGITVTRVGNTFTFELHTNFTGLRNQPVDTNGDNVGDVTWKIYYADLFFDTSAPVLTKNADKSYDMSNFNPDYGVVFSLDGGGFGGSPAPLTTLSVGFYQISSTLTANQYVDSYTKPKNAAYNYPTSFYNQDYYVKIGAGVLEENLSVNTTITPGNPGNLMRRITFTITDPTILAAFDDGFTAFWGTGTCGNDGVVAVVPVPPSLLLMGSGLLSMLGFTAARRFRSGERRRKNG